MRISRLYLPVDLKEGETLPLDERSRHYLLNVMRLKQNAEIIVFNGQGGEYRAIIYDTGKKANINIQQFFNLERESSLNLHLAQGLSKNERMDYTIQKAVELGVTTITPLQTTRSVIQIQDKRIEKRMAHWQGIIISACEQTGRTRIPTLQQPVLLSKFIEKKADKQSYYIFDTDAEDDFKSILNQDHHQNFTFLIGPEGGLDNSEFAQAVSAGYRRVWLGPRILRTETAGPIVLAITQFTKGDLGKGKE